MPMTADAKRALSSTIRALRSHLLGALHDATESRWRLSVRARDAELDQTPREERARFESWIAEQTRAQRRRAAKPAAKPAKGTRTAEDWRRHVEEQAAYTLLNRLVLLRLMEAPHPTRPPLRTPAVVTGGWESRAYKDFRQLAPALVRGDESEGYAYLLRLVFEDLATELPGLYGPAGIAEAIPVPAAALRHVVDALDDPALATCWTDDMTLGWVYQYWNDPAREALDAKLNSGGKVEPHEVASKTQMFTERYMVDWLLQNSLGPMWLAICARNGWTPEVEADGTLARLDARRADWRKKRAAGAVELTALMPLDTDAERRWAYYLPQPIPTDAADRAPRSIRDLTLIDPAVGSGHFLIVALDLLVALHREEARHRGETGQPRWADHAIVEHVIEHTLHGIDLDPRAVQIAAAALWLKGRQLAPKARPARLNLVAANLRLASLPDDDPALAELRREVERETGIPAALTDTVVHALRGADHLGSLLRVDRAVEEAIDRHEADIGRAMPQQGGLFSGFEAQQTRMAIGRDEAKASLLERLEGFLAKRTGADDLGLRLRGAQLAAGVRFVRMVQAGRYDLVVANPPYQGTSKLVDATYVKKAYPLGKADLYAAFLLRGLELVREGGVSAMLTMRNWMFIKQYAGLRAHLLGEHGLRALHDLSSGAFEEISAAQVVVSVVSSIFARGKHTTDAMALKVFDDATVLQVRETERKRAATLCHAGRGEFSPAALKVVPDWPLVYWWRSSTLDLFKSTELVGQAYPISAGVKTGDDVRFLRNPHEALPGQIATLSTAAPDAEYQFYVKGAAGAEWVEPPSTLIRWQRRALELSVYGMYCKPGTVRKRDARLYYRKGIAFSPIGHRFSGRGYHAVAIFGNMGSTIFADDIGHITCLLNSSFCRRIASGLNPGVHFELGDVERLPDVTIPNSDEIYAIVTDAFTTHESHREPSVEYRHPGPSPWHHAQDWAQQAVDRPEGTPLPPYTAQLDPEPPTDHLSYALGVTLGRFHPAGEGILDPTTADLGHAMPHGMLFLDTTLGAGDRRDGLGHPAAAPLHAAWAEHGAAIGSKRGLRGWLAVELFKDIHRQMYDNRPIHWPLSSAQRTFVAWVNIHRMSPQTLPVLLADHLVPTLARIEGELVDLRAVRDGADAKAARAADKQYGRTVAARDELAAFIADVEQCAERGAPPTDAKCPPRDQDARYAPDLDDGVMINSAGLWPLLAPQWKDPKKWWRELATAKGRKDYDWSHLAMRYWPERVDGKCQDDPSLAVAHGCFWRYHPARAWAWELRLQDEIGPDFRIEEAPYRPGGHAPDGGDDGDGPHRARFLAEQADEAIAAVEKEATRRMGRGKRRRTVPSMTLLETGLWSQHPGEMWALELRLAERQGHDLRIEAPDEPEARAAYIAAHPDEARARDALLASLEPLTLKGLGLDGADDDDDRDDSEEEE